MECICKFKIRDKSIGKDILYLRMIQKWYKSKEQKKP